MIAVYDAQTDTCYLSVTKSLEGYSEANPFDGDIMHGKFADNVPLCVIYPNSIVPYLVCLICCCLSLLGLVYFQFRKYQDIYE